MVTYGVAKRTIEYESPSRINFDCKTGEVIITSFDKDYIDKSVAEYSIAELDKVTE